MKSLATDGRMKTRLSPELIQLRQQLRNLDRSEFRVKAAELGGGNDASFEQAFGNLAHAYLKDKAPGLQDYEIGFQLVDRNQENTKAIGVFGFKVGSQWLYAPVFFLNGDLKGHELLYIKNQDLFVPLKENWLNYLLGRRPNILGEGIPKDLSRMGVIAPNLYQISRSPAKFASAHDTGTIKKIIGTEKKIAKWAMNVLPDLAHYATTSPLHDEEKYGRIPDFVDFIKDAGKPAVLCLINAVQDYPALLTTLNEYYGQERLDNAIKEAIASDVERNSILGPSKAKAKFVQGKLTVTPPSPQHLISGHAEKMKRADALEMKVRTFKPESAKMKMEAGGDTDQGATLEPKEREALMSGHVVIEDSRPDDEVSTAYDVQVPVRLQSPSETGLYEVLTKPGEFKRCLVMFHPYTAGCRKPWATVVDLESKAWLNTHPSEIWTKTKYEREVYEKWVKDLAEEDSLKKGGPYMLLHHFGEGTTPFDVTASDEDSLETYDVRFYDHPQKERPLSLKHIKDREREPLWERSQYCGKTDRLICTEKPGHKLKCMGNELIVPEGFKVLKLKDDSDSFFGISSEKSPVFDLGSAVDFQTGIRKYAGLDMLEIRSNGTFFQLDKGAEQRYDSALVDLVQLHGFREKQARDMLEIAREKKSSKYLVKYAAGTDYPLQRSGPSTPPFPEPTVGSDPMTGGQVPTQPAFEWNSVIPGMSAQLTDRSMYDPRPVAYSQPNTVGGGGSTGGGGGNDPRPDRKALETAMGAAESGQKEVFDTAMIGSMLKAVRDDSMVDRYMGDLMKGMDRLARILFMFYWHQDEFEERYGKQDMPELEDGLRNAFEAMGDIVLFLKQKTIDPYPDGVSDVDLKSISE